MARSLVCLLAAGSLAACRGCTGIDDYSFESAAQGGSTASNGPGQGGAGQGAGSGNGGDSTAQTGGGPPAGTGGSTSSSSGGGCEPCYSGPPGTEDVGICEGGLLCGGGACEGEVVPAVADDCVTAQKEDCLAGSGAACTGAVSVHGVITENAEFVFSFHQPIDGSPDGRAVAMASYLDATFIDATPLTATATSTVLFGLDESQALAWSVQRPGPMDGGLTPVAVSAEDDAFTVAMQRFDGVGSFLDIEGWAWAGLAPRSTRAFRNVSGFFALGLVAQGDEAFVAFNHDGTADLDGDGQADGVASPTQRGFFARLDASGATVWREDLVLAGDVAVHSLALASDGLWFAGMTKAELDLGCVGTVGADSAFVGRLDPTDGTCEALLAVGSLGSGFEDLELTSSLLAVSEEAVYSYFPSDGLLVARTHGLDLLWSTPLAAPFTPSALSVDGFGHPILVGQTAVGPVGVATARKLSRVDGLPVWPSELQLPSSDSSMLNAVAGRPDGSVLLGGTFFGSITLQGTPHAAGANGSASTMFVRADP